MPVQPDIAGNFFKGSAAREALSSWGEQRQDRQLQREGARRALEVETGGPLAPEINALYDPYEWSLKNVIQNWKTNFQENSPFSRQNRTQRRTERARRRALRQNPEFDLGNEISAGMADGGSVREAAEALRRANIERFEAAQQPGRTARATGALRRGLNRVAGPKTGAVAGAIPLAEMAFDDDLNQDMEDRFGWEPPNVQPGGGEGTSFMGIPLTSGDAGEASVLGYLQHLGKTGLQYASELGEMIPGVSGLYRDNQEQGAPVSNPPAALAIAEQVPAEESTPASSPSSGGAATPQSGTDFVGPATPDEEAAQLGNINVMPDDMPSMSTRDWISYRNEMVPALMMQGMSAQEAHQQVSTMQHQGFMRYARQAAMMLQAQNPQGAARALKAAYQYFPNGSDVKFGIQTDREGNPALVALALDEESGEQKGTPQLVTSEYLASMVTNFQDPSRYLAWTKDWRDEAFRERTYNEVTRPEAQSMANYRNRALDVQETNAAANLTRAMTSGSSGGVTDASLRAGRENFEGETEDMALDPDLAADRRELISVMETLRSQYPVQQVPDGLIVEKVMEAYANGNIEAVRALIGQQ